MTKRGRRPAKPTLSTVEDLLRRGHLAERAGKPAEAESLYRQALRREPRHAGALHALGLLDYRSGRLESALLHMRRAAALQDAPELLCNLGLMLAAAGRTEQAVEAYRRGLAKAPASPELHNNLGNALRRQGKAAESEAAFREAIRLAPDYAEAHNNLALLLRDLGRQEESFELLTAAVRLKPDYGPAWDNLGSHHIAAGRPDEALPCFRRAFELTPDSPVAAVNLAIGLTKTGRFDEAPALFRRAIARAPRLIEARVGLATCLAQEGKAEEAAAELRAALAIDPAFVPAYQNLAELPGQAITEEEYARLEALLGQKGLREEYRAPLLFLLARREERAGRYGKAFDLASRANAMERPRAGFSAEAEAEFLRRTMASCDAAFFRERKIRGSESELPVFVVGLPRSGTTLVEQIIASHPKAAGAGEVIELPELSKRLPALLGVDLPFPDCLRHLDQAKAAELAEGYLAHLARHHPSAARIVDKLPFNFRLLGLVALLLPRARIIHCRRDPRDTAVSLFFLHFHRPISFAYDLGDFAAYYRGYEALMAHWHRVLPMPILDVQYEELVAAPEPKIRQMLDFCGLEWDPRCLDFQSNERAVRTASLWQVRKPLYASSIGRWRRYEKQLAPLLNELAPAAPSPQPSPPVGERELDGSVGERGFDLALLPPLPPQGGEGRGEGGGGSIGGALDVKTRAPVLGRHPRESGDPGQATGAGSLDSRFRGNDGQEAGEPTPRARNALPPRPPQGGEGRGEGGGRPRAAARRPPSPWQRELAAAHALGHAGKLDEAERRLRAVLERAPKAAEIWHALGLVAYNRGDAKAALPCFARALELEPDNGAYHSALGVIYRVLKEPQKALRHLAEAVRLRPEDAAIRGNFGNALRDVKQFEKAERELRKAVELDPASPGMRINLVGLLIEQKRPEEAAEHVQAALAADPNHAPALREWGNILLSRDREVEALDYYRRAAELDPKDHLALHNMATSLQFLGRLEEAEDAYRRAVRAKPDFAEAWRQLTGVRSHKPSDAADLPELERQLENPALGDQHRAELWFALSKIHADLKHHDQAFACAQAANQIIRQLKPYSAEENSAYVDALIQTFDERFIAERPGFGVRSELPVLILGMPRSGTTLVEQILASHPQVHGAGELKKFHEIVISTPTRLGKPVKNPAAGRLVDRAPSAEMGQEYIDHLRAMHPTALRVTDKMPFNFRLLGMIALLLPEVAIIHCRRDPLDVCLSCYFARFTEELNFSYNLLDVGRYYLDYERLMAHWRRVLPLRMLDVQYEELVGDIEGVSRRMLSHCGLEWDERCLAFHETERMVKTASNWQVRQPLYSSSAGRWRKYESHLGPLIALLGRRPQASEAA